jgi:hypothetical protein
VKICETCERDTMRYEDDEAFGGTGLSVRWSVVNSFPCSLFHVHDALIDYVRHAWVIT